MGLLSTLVERFGVSCMRDFHLCNFFSSIHLLDFIIKITFVSLQDDNVLLFTIIDSSDHQVICSPMLLVRINSL